MTKNCITYLNLPDEVRRMAGMAAARKGVSVSAYMAGLVEADCEKSGIAALVAADKEVQP